MNSPGTYALADVTITAPVAGQVVTSQPNLISGAAQAMLGPLDGLLAAAIHARFVYGSGGTDAVLQIETSLDQGQSWVEVARLRFTTASAVKIVNLSALTPRATPYSPAALSNDAAADGVLGPFWRATLTTTGTYAGSTLLAVRLIAR